MFAAVQVQAQFELQVFVFLPVRAMAWEGDAQDVDLWAAVRAVMVADEEELARMLDRLPMCNLVRHQVVVALAVGD